VTTEPPPGLAGQSVRQERARAFTTEVGVIVFLGSWSMLFAGLLFAYAYLRLRARELTPAVVPWFSLAVALSAAIALLVVLALLARATEAAARGRGRSCSRILGCAAGLGVLCAALETLPVVRLWAVGAGAETAESALGCGVDVIHAAHVALGSVAAAWLALSCRRRGPEPLATALHLWTMSWRFLSGLWLAITVALNVG
jgi:heme/copper-type cytochrome/quinol oxidase subunit 3